MISTKLAYTAEFIYKICSLKIFPLLALYLVMVYIGKRWWIKKTQPLELKLILLVYNVSCSILNLYTAVGMISALLFHVENVYSGQPSPYLMKYYELYAATKIIELLDTVFMVLRHKGRQISFLHVFHHASMLILIHYALQYTPWTSLALVLAFNSVVHVFLYLHYGYTSYFTNYQPQWKRHLTQLQIFQFLSGFMYCVKGVLYHNFCVWSLFYEAYMLYLFSKFYVKAYQSPQNMKSDKNTAIE